MSTVEPYDPGWRPGDRVVCAMSGGVDSSVSAALLKEQGFQVIGLFMRSGVSGAATTGEKQGCCSVEDSMDARRVADALEIPFYALNMEEQFGAVMDYFIAAYEQGETPNPCVQCNRLLKFGHLLDFARQVGARGVATGHYAEVARIGGRLTLRRPADRAKDQTYVLFVLSQEQLAHTYFPLSALTKTEVRERARALGLRRVAAKKDSVEICFVADDYRNFLEERIGEARPGAFVDLEGHVLGRHEGIHRFTIGQRRGLGINLGRPTYVVAIEPKSGRVVLGEDRDLFADELWARDVQWLAREPLAAGAEQRVRAQIRYNHEARPARLIGVDTTHFRVCFDEPERAVTPGQAVVCFDADDGYAVAGGWIERAPGLEV